MYDTNTLRLNIMLTMLMLVMCLALMAVFVGVCIGFIFWVYSITNSTDRAAKEVANLCRETPPKICWKSSIRVNCGATAGPTTIRLSTIYQIQQYSSAVGTVSEMATVPFR